MNEQDLFAGLAGGSESIDRAALRMVKKRRDGERTGRKEK